jgi:anti-sigma regulatory factor (Ser/Thr protein kinase)
MPEKRLSFTLKNRLADLEKIHSALENLRLELGFSNKCKCETNLVLEELFTNIISYAYRDDGDHEVFLRIRIESGKMHIEIEDDGVPFDPLTAHPPCLDTNVEEREVGGLGVFFARKFADQIRYERVDGKNLVKITKRFGSDHGSENCPVASLGR